MIFYYICNMRILTVISRLEMGGAQKLIEYMLPYMKEGNEVEIVAFQKDGSDIEERIERMGVKIHYLNEGIRSLRVPFKLRKYLKWADVVHVHLFPASYFAVIGNIGINKPIIFTEHNTHNKRRNHKWLKPIEKSIYKRLRHTVCICNEASTTLNQWLDQGIAEKTSVIDNGILLEPYQEAKPKKSEEIFGRSGIPVIMISRFSLAKDQATVVKALEYIENPDVFIVFAGDGETRAEIEELAKNLKVEDKVLFLGNRSDIPDLIKSSYIGLQSSHWEGFPLTAIEIMAGGLPLIGSRVKGLKDVVENSGLLFEEGDAKGLAYQINKLIKDPSLYDSYKAKSLNDARKYSIEETSRKYLELFKKIAFS